MARTLLQQTQLRGDSLTGFSLNDSLGIYDETDGYAVGDKVYWNRHVWQCTVIVAAGPEGDLSNAPNISASWQRAPFEPALVSTAVDYVAGETWLFDVLEVDTTAATRTATLPIPAVTATWLAGFRMFIYNIGTNNVTIDPNGNLLSGKSNTRSIIKENGWVEIVKVDDELIVVDSYGSTFGSVGDIPETIWNPLNNQAAPVDVTDLVFDNTYVQSFIAQVSIHIDATAALYEVFELYGIQKTASWDLTVVSTGDYSNIEFTITAAGQVQYISGNETGWSVTNGQFRASTTSV